MSERAREPLMSATYSDLFWSKALSWINAFAARAPMIGTKVKE